MDECCCLWGGWGSSHAISVRVIWHVQLTSGDNQGPLHAKAGTKAHTPNASDVNVHICRILERHGS